MHLPALIRAGLLWGLLLLLPSCNLFDNDDENAKTVSPRDYWGAQVTSNQSFKYGRFLTKMRAPRKSGAISSFFTDHCVDPGDSCKQAEEIDIEFVRNKSSRTVQVNIDLKDSSAPPATIELDQLRLFLCRVQYHPELAPRVAHDQQPDLRSGLRNLTCSTPESL